MILVKNDKVIAIIVMLRQLKKEKHLCELFCQLEYFHFIQIIIEILQKFTRNKYVFLNLQQTRNLIINK